MKILLVGAGLAAATVVFAQEPQASGPPQGPQPQGQMSMMRASPILAVIDVNGDGAISADELANAPKFLKTLDKNGDGVLSREEAGLQFGGRGGRGGDRGRGPGEAEAPPAPGP